jgi:glycosyltransferase involved in cell wall biosynthesis
VVSRLSSRVLSPLPQEARSAARDASFIPLPAPLVRVVIPAFRSTYMIRDVVAAALRSQGHFNLQIVVVDDGDNGNLQQLLSGMAVTIVCTGGSGSAAIARNHGTQGFEGEHLVFIDADVLIDQSCIEILIEPLRNGRADATVGNYSQNVSGLPFAARYKQLYISKIYQRRAGYLLNEFWTAIGAIDARIFRGLKGFDSSFTGAGGEDTELGRRLTQNGFRTLAVPEALGDHRHSLSLPQLLRNDWRKGMLAMGNYYESEGSLSHNRHATRRDMLAAGIASLTLALTLSPFFGYPLVSTCIVIGLFVCCYLASRADILRTFSSQGPWFVVRASALVFGLDVMRSACFATGTGHRMISHLANDGDKRVSVENSTSVAPGGPAREEQYLEDRLSI